MPDTTTTIVGNLTDDPELRFTQGGTPVANFTVAVTPRRPDGQGGWTDGETSFIRCTAWRSLAENLADSLGKGDRVLVYGRLQQRSWETDAGERRSIVEVQVDELGPSLRWATAKPDRGNREGEPLVKGAAGAAKGGQFTDEPPF
jgi:single-strand DNA-binding protein